MRKQQQQQRRSGPSSGSKPLRPKFVPISEEMKAWSAALGSELAGWPGVASRPMFGFFALYRGKRIFAILPRTRGMGSANSLAFKLQNAKPRVFRQLRDEPRISITVMRASRCFVFELARDSDLSDALDWLRRAYEAA